MSRILCCGVPYGLFLGTATYYVIAVAIREIVTETLNKPGTLQKVLR